MVKDIWDSVIDFLLSFIPILLMFVDIKDPFKRGFALGFVVAFYPSIFIIKHLKKKRKRIAEM